MPTAHPPAATPQHGRWSVAVLQATGVVGAAGQNLAAVEAAAAQAVARGCRLLVTPELFVSGYDPAAVAGDDGAAQRAALSGIASRHGIALVASTVETRPMNGSSVRSISASLFERDGRERTRYRKQHLFGPAEEGFFATGADAPEVVDVDGVAVALGLCFDVEFPEFVRAVAAAGADLLAVPTAVPVRAPDSRFDVARVATLLVPARALENGLHLAYADHHGPRFAGLSSITDPWGRQSALAGPDGRDLLVADVDVAEVAAARADTPYLEIAGRCPPPGGATDDDAEGQERTR